MIYAYITEQQQKLDFARAAALHFANNPKHWTYTAAEVETGAYLALRWGLGDDCVLVLRIGDEVPVIYSQAIRHVQVTVERAP